MPFLEIHLPTGHKSKVEVTVNTSLNYVLEDVCAKWGYKSENCYLKHNNAQLDLSAKFGMCNLINNAKLSLIDTKMSLIENAIVEVTLQLPNNRRLKKQFSPKDTLWFILTSFHENESSTNPEIIPMDSSVTPVIFNLRDQIIGQFCLENTTLFSMGFRTGRVLLRLEHRIVQNDELERANTELRKRLEVAPTEDEQTYLHNKDETPASTSVSDYVPFRSVPSYIQSQTTTNDFNPFSPFNDSGQSMFDGSMKHFDSTVEAKRKKSKTLGELLGISLDDEEIISNQPDFSNFKFPESSERDVLVQSSNEATIDNDPLDLIENRCAVFFIRKVASQVLEQEELPESFFDVTEEDLRIIIQSYKDASNDDNMLMTKALRQDMRDARFSKYERCIIQFHFPDSFVLQSEFKPNETVGHLYTHIKQFFHNDKAHPSFQLYTTPPKVVLKDSTNTLVTANLVPMTKVFVTHNAKDIANGPIDNLLSKDADESCKEMILRWMKKDKSSRNGGNDRQSSSRLADQSGSSVVSRNSRTKVPDWFKIGK